MTYEHRSAGDAELARELMQGFAGDTGLDSGAPPRRYLWTDAFAVCNWLGLARESDEPAHRQRALRLIEQVHHVLGRHRPDDPRTGWISGLSEDEGRRHPTAGGLRIGKPEPERAPGEPHDPRAEWDRDGQYYHYLTRWMHALDRAHAATGRPELHRWAVELARVAHAAFVYRVDSGRRMYWKMSIDLSRPLLPSMGGHDPLDGYVTLCSLRAGLPEGSDLLDEELAELAAMCRGRRWATDDPLGAGGLLNDVWRLARLLAGGELRGQPGGVSPEVLLASLLEQSVESVAAVGRSGLLAAPAGHRLAFRELGLAIGLAAVARLDRLDLEALGARVPGFGARSERLRPHLDLEARIVDFWTQPAHRQAATWTGHLDINRVMLATALAPEGYLGV